MPWYFPWSESIKKKACRYLLQHYLGEFLKEKLALDQLTVDLYNGKGSVTDVPLDVWALNEMLGSAGLPVEMVDGFIARISVQVPWKALLSESCQIEIEGLELTFAPKHKGDENMFDSNYSWNSMSMTTSIQLAQECLRQESSLGDTGNAESGSFEGLEAFAQTIESVLARVRLSFINTLIRFEHIPRQSASGVGLELHIERIDYADLSNEEVGGDSQAQHSVYEPVAIAIKNFQIKGLSLYMDEFPRQKRTKLCEASLADDMFLSSQSELGTHCPSEPEMPKRISDTYGSMEFTDFLPRVKILSLSSGKQNIKMRLKQNDALPGPKFDLEYSLGSLSLFLTPRQLHLLIDALSSIPDPVAGHKESNHSKKQSKVRVMKREDYMRVEQSLQQNFSTSPGIYNVQSHLDSLNLNAAFGQTDSSQLSISGSEEEFYSMTEYPLPALGQPPINVKSQPGVCIPDSATFSTSPGSTVSASSYGASSGLAPSKGSLTERASTVFKPATSVVNGPKLARNFSSPQPANIGLANVGSLEEAFEVTRLKFRASNLIFILLHQDPLVPSALKAVKDGHVLVKMSDDFFSQVAQFSMQTLFGMNSEEIRDSMLTLCPWDHIRILSSAVMVELESRSSSGSKTVNTDIIVGKISVDENLFNEAANQKASKSKFCKPYSQSQLLAFVAEDEGLLYPGAFSSSQSPSIKIRFSRVQRSRNSVSTSAQSRTSVLPKSLITVEIGRAVTELDITLLDRLVALLKPGPLYHSSAANASLPMYSSLATGASANHQTAFRQVMEESPVLLESKADLSIKCPEIVVILRFPVLDLRPVTDIEKRPWWRKALHKESMKLEISMLELRTSLHAGQMLSSYEVQFRKIKGTFVVPDSGEYHVFDIDCPAEEGDLGSMGLDLPRILISTASAISQSVLDDSRNPSKESSPESLEDQYTFMKHEPSPFASRPAMYDNEAMVMPGSKEDMCLFQEAATFSSKLAINCYFPCMKMNLHSKDVFELMYNRLLSDLMLWQPLAPSSSDNRVTTNPYENVHINLASHVGQLGGDRFLMCKSAIRDAYDTHSQMDSFFSGDYVENPATSHPQQSNICFALHIDRGSIAMFPPHNVPSSESTTTITSQSSTSGSLKASVAGFGHVVLNIADGHFFMVSGYKGQANVDFMELHANDVELHHGPTINSSVDMHCMDDALHIGFLNKTVFMSETPLLSRSKAAGDLGSESTAMLSLAIKCTSDVLAKRKDNVVAVGVRGGTLRYRTSLSEESWIQQVVDFMSVNDYPILGYSFPLSITALHTHLWGCAVDYRPLYLPMRSLLTVEAFSLTSNIIPGSSTSVLRFLLEDSTFYISNKMKEEIDLDADYVPILDMGNFELSLRLTDGMDVRQPKVDLSMSNNLLNVRTCSDSCQAFIKLLQYVASDGDLHSSAEPDDSDETDDKANERPAPALLEGEVSENFIGNLMAEAMKDDNPSSLLPAEKMDFHSQPINHLVPLMYQDRKEGEDVDDLSGSDEYCFLDDENDYPNVDDQAPTVKKLISQNICVIEDFFQVPLGHSDQLMSPADYPPVVYRYMLKEMSVLWQMYGGRDFDVPLAATPSSSRSRSSPATAVEEFYQRKQERSSSTNLRSDSRSEALVSPTKRGSTVRTQRHRGGPGRDLDTLMELQFNKIRFQHEVYPEGCDKIYRDVLLVYDFEVRDRLTASQINKFMYQFSTEDMPRQSHAHMLTVKFLVERPEDTARSQEASLRVSLQPIRMNVDQDSLLFLKTFFGDLTDGSPSTHAASFDLASVSSSPSTEPFQAIHRASPQAGSSPSPRQAMSMESSKSEKPSTLFFRSFVFSPDVPIRLDYHGKHVSMEQGTLSGLLIGLAQLNCSEIHLKRLNCRSGLLGPDKLVNYVLTEWLNDIRQNQLQSILGGVGPAYSFVQLFQGIKDLFWMPVQQYRQDGRIVRGLQRGAQSFSTSTAMAVLELSNRLVSAIQSIAELTFDMVSPGPSVSACGQGRLSGSGVHPTDFREGVANAYNLLSEGLSQTAMNIAKVASEEHEKKGMTGAVGGVLRQVPPTVVKPLILAAEAASNVLGGARNQLAPDKRREAVEKWKVDP